jgi:hypothetical protein
MSGNLPVCDIHLPVPSPHVTQRQPHASGVNVGILDRLELVCRHEVRLVRRCHAGQMTHPVIRLTRPADMQRVESHVEAESDARLACGVAIACVIAQVVLLLAPVGRDLGLPVGIDALWLIGGLLTVLLMPVVAGLAAFTGVRAFLVHGRRLPARVQRLHVVTLSLVIGLFVWRVSGLAAPALGRWAE